MKPGRLIKRIVSSTVWALALAIALVVALFALRPTVPVDFLVPGIERSLSDALGRSVTLSNVACRVALEPTVSADSVRVTEPGTDGPDLVAATSLRFTTSLRALLFARTVSIKDASIQDLELRLSADPEEKAPAEPRGKGSPAERPVFPLLDLEALRVERLLLHYSGERLAEDVTLSNLEISAPLVEPAHVALQAAWRDYRATIDFLGGNLNSLLRGPSVWPARLEMVTDLGTLEASALLRGSPFPGDPKVTLTGVLKDLSLDPFLPAGRGLGASRVLVHARWEGLSIPEILTSMDLQGMADDVVLTVTDETEGIEPQAYLEQAMVAWSPGEQIMVVGEGELLGEATRITMNAGPVTSWPPEEGLPFALRGEAAGARLRAFGTWEGRWDEPALQLSADLGGDRVGELAAWFGFSPDADLPYRLRVGYRLQGGTAHLELKEAYIGSTRLTGHWERAPGSDGSTREIVLAFDRVDLQELSRISGDGRPMSVEDRGDDASSRLLRLDVPVLPGHTRLPDADLLLEIAELHTAQRGFENVRTQLTFRDGWLERSPFSLDTAGASWNGECFLDARKAVPVFGMELRADDVAVDELILILEDDPDLSVVAGRVLAQAQVEGATVRQMLDQNRVVLQAEDVEIRLPRPGRKEPAQILIPALNIARPTLGEDLRLEAEMTIGGKAVHLRGHAGRLVKADKDGALGLHLEGMLEAETTEISVAGDIRLPLRAGDIDLAVHLLTDTPAWLTDQAGLDWEPVAPLECSGRLEGRDGQYKVHDLAASLNQSRLTGHVQIGITPEEILWQLAGRSEVLYLEDLGMGGRTNEVDSVAEEETPETSSDGGRAVKGKIALQLDEVHYLGEALGGGTFGLSIEPGRIAVQPVHLESEDRYGDVFFASEETSAGNTNQYDVGVTATNLPFNLLALLSPKFATSEAMVYSDARLVSAMPADDPRFAAHLNGELGFAVFPEKIRSRFLDYWAVGAFQALGMTLTGRGESKVECIAGRLHFEDGMARPHEMYIDTSRMRVKCTGWIDFNSGKLHLKMKPRPKGMAFISLATPVEVKGSLDDPDIQVTTKALAGTVLRVYFWFVTAIDSLFRKNIPEYDHEGYMRMMSGQKP